MISIPISVKILVWKSGLYDWCRGCMKCAELCSCWWGVQWRVWSEGQCSPRLSTQPASLHHCAWSLITRVLLWGPLGGPLYEWPYYHRWIALGMCQKALELERSNEKERTGVNAGKTKIMICGTGLDLLQSSGQFPCAVCRTGVATASSAMGANTGCTRNAVGSSAWQRTLTTDVHSARELHVHWTAECRPQREVQVGPDKLQVVASFRYLEDMLSAEGGCELSTATHVKTAMKNFKELLPVLSSCHLSLKTRGCVYSSCVWSAMLHASETWP